MRKGPSGGEIRRAGEIANRFKGCSNTAIFCGETPYSAKEAFDQREETRIRFASEYSRSTRSTMAGDGCPR